MREILLTRGMIAQISDEDYDLNEFSWFYSGRHPYHYTIRQVQVAMVRETIFMHKVIATRIGLIGGIDHEDRNRLNNQRYNLREATQQQNLWNIGIKAMNTSGYIGVSYNLEKRKYEAYIRILKGERTHLGYFDTAEKAAREYDRVAKRFRKKFAVLNFTD